MSDPTRLGAQRASRLPQGFIGMLALVLIVELTIAGRRLDFTTIWSEDWRISAESATRRSQGQDLLCFGDSLVKFGVLPREIEARTGLRSYNLAVNAGTMPSAYFLLRRALESGATPKAIGADFCTLMQPERPENLVRLYPELATTRECFELAWIARDSHFFTTALLVKLLPSYQRRFEIRESVKAALDGRRASPWPRQMAIWTRWNVQKGAQPMPPAASTPILNSSMVADLSPDHWECDSIDAAYFEKFLDLASSRKIPVFWLIPPMSPVVEATRARNKSDEAYTRFVRAAQERHPELVVFDGRRSGYDGSVYIDEIHLDSRGAKVLTGDLAALIADRLKQPGPAPRWVEMPAFAGRAEAVAQGSGEASTR